MLNGLILSLIENGSIIKLLKRLKDVDVLSEEDNLENVELII